MQAQYIALSHRWGGKNPIKTERGNLNQRTEGFPYTDLPPLFRDAVDTALALDTNYIWIDSLCIVQDDPEDWRAEAAKMADVYMNAYLTIAASAVPNSDSSFLCGRETTPKVVKLPQNDDTVGDWSLYVEEQYSRSFRKDADEAPLNKRAWVLQERILSPRILHFTRTQVYWECWSRVEYETLEYDRGNYHKSSFPVSLSPRGIQDTSIWGWHLKEWLGIVEKYTSCQLTFASDKLVAIGGLVERIRSDATDQFFGGVFLSDLHYQLLWGLMDNSCSSFLPGTLVPTWSWASRDGAVRFAESEVLEPEHTTRLVESEQSEHLLLDLKADIYSLDKNVLIGEQTKPEGWHYYRGEQEMFYRCLPLKDDKTQRFRFMNQNDDVVGAFLLDHETGDDTSFKDIFWVMVARYVCPHRKTLCLYLLIRVLGLTELLIVTACLFKERKIRNIRE